MKVSRAELEPQILTVRAALASWKAALGNVSSPDARDDMLSNYSAFLRAIEVWATTQRDQVVAGTRPLEQWRRYGDELKDNIEKSAAQIDFTARWSSSAEYLGDLSEKALRPLDEQVAALRKELNARLAQAAQWEKDRNALAPVRSKLSAKTVDLYWGPQAKAASAALARFKYLVEGLESGLRALHGGQSVDFEALVRGPQRASGLGSPVTVVAVAAAVVGVAWALNATLKTYFLTSRDEALIELAKVDPDAAKALSKDIQVRDDETSPVLVGLAVLGGTAVIAAAVAAWLNRDKFQRKVNPRRRRKRKEAHA